MTVPQPPTTAEELRRAGLRVTAARVALLEAVRTGDHPDAEPIASRVSDRLGAISRQAAYEALHAIVCRSCGAVAGVDRVVGELPCLTASGDDGFLIDGAQITFWGLCPGCRDPELDLTGGAFGGYA